MPYIFAPFSYQHSHCWDEEFPATPPAPSLLGLLWLPFSTQIPLLSSSEMLREARGEMFLGGGSSCSECYRECLQESFQGDLRHQDDTRGEGWADPSVCGRERDLLSRRAGEKVRHSGEDREQDRHHQGVSARSADGEQWQSSGYIPWYAGMNHNSMSPFYFVRMLGGYEELNWLFAPVSFINISHCMV